MGRRGVEETIIFKHQMDREVKMHHGVAPKVGLSTRDEIREDVFTPEASKIGHRCLMRSKCEFMCISNAFVMSFEFEFHFHSEPPNLLCFDPNRARDSIDI